MFVIIIYFAIICYIIARLTCGRCYSKVCLTGKTAIVTGGCSGIGLQTCLDLASRGCKVIIADKIDATAAKNRIIAKSHNANIVTKHIDLTSFDSIRKFADEIKKIENKLDILVLNAGIAACNISSFTENSIQTTMQVNYLGHFLLTHLLVDLLKKTGESRVVFVSSILAFFHDLKLDVINPPKNYYNFTNTAKLYCNSKMCVIIACNEFAKKLKGSGITFNSLNPGASPTTISESAFRDDGNFAHWLIKAICFIWGKSAEQAAQTSIYLAVANEVKNTTGKHFWDCRQFFMPFKARDQKFCEEMWKISEELVQLQKHEKI